ncbi:MAG: GNAT family N-acetyltransferase [Chloroflexi bacterium]|nr:GNAT family N-acetyltransferase [Chloroflexota bacterium]
MITIRHYRKADAPRVGVLIADTYSEFNLSYASPKKRAKLLGPFHYARSRQHAHRDAIAQALRAPVILVAEDDGEIVSVLRGGRKDKQRIVLQSLFVKKSYQRQGIGRKLVERFERGCLRRGATAIRLLATLYAIPFYAALGYKRSTGVRTGKSFQGTGFKYQPMRKMLREKESR